MILYSPGKKIFTELDKNGVTVHNRQIGGIGSGTSSIFGFVHKPSFVSLKDMVSGDSIFFCYGQYASLNPTEVWLMKEYVVVANLSWGGDNACRRTTMLAVEPKTESVFYKDDPLFLEAKKFLDYGTVLFSRQKFVFV
ncbi:hypothetical protein NC653_019580 [Populus alba x Populus x berolinensis]|uniref:Uncharacterized protein n=1 Tax=Populus alba x Populus x berolinensis TaxID=444605 RepID=A0AAD6VXH5_9ROSI|nr:hypothetical protein NC653_019580 [Populus alba x Populus x berolinensis]